MGEVSPVLFQKLEKGASIFGKNTLIVDIYGLHFSCGFMSFREKKQTFNTVGPFSHGL